MGIRGLSRVLADHAPSAISERNIAQYSGKRIAVDASMSLYQFLIAVRGHDGAQLTSATGNATSHLVGLFYRTIRMIEHGLKPVYVFDGKPPELKRAELDRRAKHREEAQQRVDDQEDEDAKDKWLRRTVKVNAWQSIEARQLLELMGVPYIDAPGEAEAQCADLVKRQLVYATATEDMDALTFGSNLLLRHMTLSEARKMQIQEFRLDDILEQMHFSREQFIDLCILLGCDYCDTLKGVGPKRAFAMIKVFGSIEGVLKSGKLATDAVPDRWNYEEARRLFAQPHVDESIDASYLRYNDPLESELLDFLCKERQFSEERVRAGIEKLRQARSSSSVQTRLDSFFTLTRTINPKRTATPTTAPKKKRKTMTSRT
nr:MAG: putative endonuclease [Apis mellifra filamentous-like virus]